MKILQKLQQAEELNQKGKRKRSFRKYRKAKKLEWKASEERKSGVKFKEYFSKEDRKIFKAKTNEAGNDNIDFRSEQIGITRKGVEEDIISKFDKFILDNQLAIGSAPQIEKAHVMKKEEEVVGEVVHNDIAKENTLPPGVNTNLAMSKRDPLLAISILQPGQTGTLVSPTNKGKLDMSLPVRSNDIPPVRRAVPGSIGT